MVSLPVYSGIDVPKLYMNTGLQLMPLSASSQIILSRRPPWKESSPYISTVSKKGVVVTVPGTPRAGGRMVVAHGKLRRPVKNFHTAIVNVVQTPSFIGEESRSAK